MHTSFPILRHRQWLSTATFAALVLANGDAGAIPAFPGALGFGAAATGGRGGQVLKVTTLSPTGPGSLQEALDAPGPRIIVFEVSGVIDGDITITHGDVTIAGETAPGAGLTIAGRLFAEYDDTVGNIIVRFVRVRPTYDGSDGQQFDGAQLSLNHTVILDHVSIAWGVDETLDLYEADDVTVQWSTIEESATTGHPEGEHNYGLINGPDGHRISIHHNLFIHHKNRNPAVANGPAEIVNNVAYNVRHGFVHHNPASGPFNIVGNAYVDGPDDDLIPFFFDDENGFGAPDLGYFLADNHVDDPGVFTGVVDNPWMMPFVHPSFEYLNAPESLRADTAYDFAGVTPGYVKLVPEPSQQALTSVLDLAGAFPRDVVTNRLLDEFAAKNGDWGVDAPADLMEGLSAGAPPADGDGDGMPDAWETEHGHDPSADDSTKELPSGYTAVEEYLHCTAAALLGQSNCGAGGSGTGGNGTGGSGTGGNGTGGNGTGGNGAGGNQGGNGAGGSADGGGNPSAGGSGGGSSSGDGGGCGCGFAGDAAAPGATGLLLAVLALVRRRRREYGQIK
jgi:pectate lyase